MIKNYFKSAWRNITANKLFTILNIAGLAIGLSVCIILFAYVANEWSFDRMYKNSKNIYRVNMKMTVDYNFGKWAELPNAVGPAIRQNIPQVKSVTRLIKDDFGATATLKVGENNFVEKGLYLADSTVFTIFDFHFLEGNIATAFVKPHSIVLSLSAKQRLFGSRQAMGKPIYVNNRDTLYVSGVYKDLPKNSTIDCDMIYNIMDSRMGKNLSWSNASFETYCLLYPNEKVNEVQKLATALIDKNVPNSDQYYSEFILQPLTKIHLYSIDLRQGYSSRIGSITNVRELLFLGLLVLIIACINYMNLATARSQKRTKSIGVNKVLGATFRQMALNFYLETGILTLVSIVLGYGLSLLFVPLFQSFIGGELNLADLLTVPIMGALVALWIVVTIIAGSYPAISISRLSPLVLMKKSVQKRTSADTIRRLLVVFQFASSISLIVTVIIILQQMRFIRNKNLGYNPKGVVSLSVKSARNKQTLQTTVNDLKSIAGVKEVSAVQSIPGNIESGRLLRKFITDKEGLPVKTCHTDGAVVSALQLHLLAGTHLPQSLAKNDTTCYTLINQVVANYLGFKDPQDAIGKPIITEMANRSVIVGVLKNFNYQSLKNQIGGFVYYEMNNAPEPVRTLLVRYDTHDLAGLMTQLQQVFKNDLPNTAFDYQFLDQHVQNLYMGEQHTMTAVAVFSVLAIFIACLGLFGLAAFVSEQRTKEIGIRKVLGASIGNVVRLFTKDFVFLVLLAIVIAIPASWWIMNKWLENFAYAIKISWWIFLAAGFIAVTIALVTVSFQAIKSAIANPVKSLRTE